jgi:hypothetical protein
MKHTGVSIRNEPVEEVIFCRLIKNARMQVEPCEIPFTGAPEILRVASRRVRSDYLPRRRDCEAAG